MSIYNVLHACYGPQHWWPKRTESAWEIMLGAVLTQRTSWRNAAQALDNLYSAWGPAGLSEPELVLQASDTELADLLRPAGHYNSKTRKIKTLARFVLAEGGVAGMVASNDRTEALRARLLTVWGIGPETADAILLYALQRPVFVADAYALRLVSRWDLLGPEAKYADIQRLFMDNLPHDTAMFDEYHALIVAHGKEICRPVPQCHICPLNRAIYVEVDGHTPESWRCPRRRTLLEVRKEPS